MKFFTIDARACAHATRLFCLFLAFSVRFMVIANSHSAPAPQHPNAECSGLADLHVDRQWQDLFLNCKVTAEAQNVGNPPIVSVEGDQCYPSEGTMQIASLQVYYSSCGVTETYLILAVDGVVEVDLIDPA